MANPVVAGASVQFGPFRLDMANRLLSRDGRELSLPPRALGVLWLLVSRAGHVVSKQDLLDEVWKDAFVSDTSLAEAVSLLRQALGDDPQQPVYIQTLPRRGYRFIAPVAPPGERGAPAPVEAAHVPAAARVEPLWIPWLPYLLVFVAGVAVGLAVMARARPAPTPPRGVVRFSIDLGGARVDPSGRPLAVTDLGDRLAVVARDASGATTLRTRRLSDPTLHVVAESGGAASPFFSPDGRSVAFFARGRLWRVPVSGGVPTPLAEAHMPLGGTWTDDDTIVFASRWTGGLQRVAARGGDVRTLSLPEPALGELRHAWPEAVGGTSRVVFTVAYSPRAADGGRVAVVDLRSGEVRRLEARATEARPLPTGHLLLAAPDGATVVPVDPQWTLVTGSTLALPDRPHVDEWSGGAAVTVARTGVRVALDRPTGEATWYWIDAATGRAGEPVHGLEGLDDVTVERQGGRAAGIERHGSRAALWVVDLARAVRTRIAAAPRLASPAWSGDGLALAFASSDGGPFAVWSARVDDGGAPERVYAGPGRSAYPSGWGPDARLVVTTPGPDRGLDVAVVPTRGVEGERRDLVATAADEGAGVVSPDGRWLAYETNEGGRWGIAVRALLEEGSRVVVAAEGRQPSWIDTGTLVYLAGDELRRVRSTAQASFAPEPAVVVASGLDGIARGAAAGGRVLARRGRVSVPPSVTLEWFDDLRARLEASQPAPRSFR